MIYEKVNQFQKNKKSLNKFIFINFNKIRNLIINIDYTDKKKKNQLFPQQK